MKDKRLTIVIGDITQQKVDAIVNAANSSLCVDGAIHKAAGSSLLEECKTHGGCPTGEAKITKGYNLYAKYVIHTVGPIWKGGYKDEDKKLANCYRNSFKFVEDYNIKTIALPSISTGVYKFPIEKASKIAVREIREFLEKCDTLEKVFVVCFDENTYVNYTKNIYIGT
jgi:O-acetyl-ADP-ribose deacetylase (regulator of RNase III)